MWFDALRSTIGRSVMWDFSEYVPVVAVAYNKNGLVDDCGKNKQYAIISQDMTKKSFQKLILNHSL